MPARGVASARASRADSWIRVPISCSCATCRWWSSNTLFWFGGVHTSINWGLVYGNDLSEAGTLVLVTLACTSDVSIVFFMMLLGRALRQVGVTLRVSIPWFSYMAAARPTSRSSSVRPAIQLSEECPRRMLFHGRDSILQEQRIRWADAGQ
jgi:hypothetical protein